MSKALMTCPPRSGPVSRSTPPEGDFASVSAGGVHTCGVRVDGSVACWGNNEDG